MSGHRPWREIQERRRSGAAGPHGKKSPDRYNEERGAVEQEAKDSGDEDLREQLAHPEDKVQGDVETG